MPEKRITTRRSLLKAAGATVVVGGGLAGNAAAGENWGNGKKKIPICHCPPGLEGVNCKTLYLPKPAAKKHVENHPYDHFGKCSKEEKKKPKYGNQKNEQ